MEAFYGEYVEALAAEISHAEPQEPISTIYFGGGTPTVLSNGQLSAILAAVRERFEVEPDVEITLEANPGTVSLRKLRNLRAAGFNRISLGFQAMDDGALRRIGRVHSADEGLAAYQAAREAEFDNIGIDLIYGLPEQTLEDWQSNLEHALGLCPEHASLYELSIEEGTPFAEKQAAGQLNLPDEDSRLEMYEVAIRTLAAAGYEHYEISNFARPGFRSRHNQVYWRNESYFGFGAGSARYLDEVRCGLTKSVQHYITCIRQRIDPIGSCERLTGRALMGETIMLGLRALEGVDLGEFEKRFGVPLMDAYGETVCALQNDGLVELTKDRLKLTHRGLLMANRAAAEFVETERR